jgi:hypothetical protein
LFAKDFLDANRESVLVAHTLPTRATFAEETREASDIRRDLFLRLGAFASVAAAVAVARAVARAVAGPRAAADPRGVGASIVDVGAGASSCKQKGCDSVASALNSCIGSLPKDSFGSRCGPDGKSDPMVAAKIEHACSPQVDAYLACLSK